VFYVFYVCISSLPSGIIIIIIIIMFGYIWASVERPLGVGISTPTWQPATHRSASRTRGWHCVQLRLLWATRLQRRSARLLSTKIPLLAVSLTRQTGRRSVLSSSRGEGWRVNDRKVKNDGNKQSKKTSVVFSDVRCAVIYCDKITRTP